MLHAIGAIVFLVFFFAWLDSLSLELERSSIERERQRGALRRVEEQASLLRELEARRARELEAESERCARGQKEGVVSWFNALCGAGYIKGDDGSQVRVAAGVVIADAEGRAKLKEGDRVAYLLNTERRSEAQSVLRIASAGAEKARRRIDNGNN